MRPLVVFGLALMLTGCVSDSAPLPFTAAARVSLRQQRADIAALVNSHKISHAEGARRVNAAMEKAASAPLGSEDHLMMAYRVALASEVDAGRMTEETAEFKMQEKFAEIQRQDRRDAMLALMATAYP